LSEGKAVGVSLLFTPLYGVLAVVSAVAGVAAYLILRK